MPDLLGPYGDIEQLLLDWAATRWPDLALDVELPYNTTFNTDLVVFTRLGGPMRDVPGLEDPTIDIDAFAVGRDRAKSLARVVATAVRHRLAGQPLSDGTTRVKAVRS